MDFYQAVLLILSKSFQTILLLFPYLLGGIIVGELLKFTSWTRIIYRWANRSPFVSVLAAAVLGAVSPLCTVGTVPVMIRLHQAGVKIAPLVTFLVVSSMMNPQLFIITWGGLGAEIAWARLAAVLVFGTALGITAHYLPEHWVVKRKYPAGLDAGKEILDRKNKKFEWKAFAAEVLGNLEYIGFYLLIGTLLGSILEVAVPAGVFRSLFAQGSFWSVLLAAFLGVPLYACGGATIPLVQSFMKQGMDKTAALAFLLVGPATRVAPLAALASVIRIRFIVFYIFSLFVFSIAIGVVFH